MTRSILIIATVVSGLVGCAPQYSTPQQAAANACTALGPRAMSGALIGGLGGAAAGAAIGGAAGGGRGAGLGAGIGALTGVIGGLAVGHQMDQNDCAQAQIALQQASAAQIGQVTYWNSPSGSHGTYTALSEDTTVNGRICRNIRSDFEIQGHQPAQDTGLTCRTPNGDWERVS